MELKQEDRFREMEICLPMHPDLICIIFHYDDDFKGKKVFQIDTWSDELVILADGKFANANLGIQIFNSKSGVCELTLDNHAGAIRCMAALPDTRLASGNGDGSIKIWNTLSRECELTLTGITGYITHITFLQDEMQVMTE